MKRVLVVAYYFPPMGLSGVQRIAKFVKYLPHYGWKPTVLTVEPGGYFAFDKSLEDDLASPDIQIERTKSIDPTRLFKNKSTVSLPAESSRKWLSWISQAVFVPDNKIGWIRPAVQRGLQLHAETPFDAILATVPPYSSALVARQISDKTGLPYVLDYRDDWLDNPRHEYPTPVHRLLHRVLEKRALFKTSAVISINEPIARRISDRIRSYFKESDQSPVHVIAQGYDQADFSDKRSITNDGILTLVYSGVFYDVQTPDYFLTAVAQLVTRNPAYRSRIKVIFVGLIPESSKALVESLGIIDLVEYTGYVSHDKAIEFLLAADVLWMMVGNGKGQELISTSKLYEYMGTQKPILGFVPEGAAKTALEAYKASWVVFPSDVDRIVNVLETVYHLWEMNELPRPDAEFVHNVERKHLTGKLSNLLDTLSSF